MHTYVCVHMHMCRSVCIFCECVIVRLCMFCVYMAVRVCIRLRVYVYDFRHVCICMCIVVYAGLLLGRTERAARAAELQLCAQAR